VTDSASGTTKSNQTVAVSPVPALAASFTYTPSQPSSGQSVSFAATGTGGVSPYTYVWNFGDSGTSTGQSPTHTYSNSGSYTVTLNVTDFLGTHALSTQTITVSPPGALTASFTITPAIPVSGQTVTFTATASGGTSPYTYSWNLAGAAKTGNPVSQSFTNGTYTVTLNVTDNAGKSVKSSQTLTVLSKAGGSTVPVLVGWGGIRLDEAAVGGGVNQPTNPPPSAVFRGEPATNMELALIEMKAMGYNTVRVDFDPACTASQYMSAYSATNLQRAIQIAQYYGFWIIVDYHGYSEPFNSTQATCWLNFWSGVTSQFKNSYSQIIWEPLNEPCYDSSSCAGSSTTNDMCSGASACVGTLSHEYQLWINQTRAQGDTHWIVVQNICSYGCSLSNWANGYPTVNDPLGTLTQGGRMFISLHSYMGYSSSNWNNATAESTARQYYNAVVSGVATTGWPALNTEGGADPLCTSCAPDQILTGSAGYTTVTFHFIQTLTSLYDTNAPQRINWIWWPAGSWTNTPGAGIYGALQCNSNPIGWGCLLKFAPLGPPVPDFALSANPSSLTVNTGTQATSTISLNILNGFASTVTLTTSSPAGLSVSLSSSNITGTSTSTLTVSSTSSGIYQVTIIGSGGSLTRQTTVTVTIGNEVAPVLNAPATETVDELTTLTFAVGATDSSTPSPTLTITASQLRAQPSLQHRESHPRLHSPGHPARLNHREHSQ
jgi:PKD repeat protein